MNLKSQSVSRGFVQHWWIPNTGSPNSPPPLLLTRCPHRAPKLSRPPPGSQIAVFTAPGHGNQGDSHKIPIPGATPQIYHGIIGEFITELWNTRFLSQTTYILHFVGLEIHLRTSSRLQMLKFYRSLKKDNFRQFFFRSTVASSPLTRVIYPSLL